MVQKKACDKCDRIISLSNYDNHYRACRGPLVKTSRKIVHVDYDPNAGYKDGTRVAWNKGLKGAQSTERLSDEEVFIENASYARGALKKRILRKSLMKYECAECGNDGMHNGKELVLHLDHINGVHNDHRFTNLRFLCPNCHSQSDTYAGKRKAYKGH